MDFENLLSGGDLRSLGRSGDIVSGVKDQSQFDELFSCLFHPRREVVMRAADVIEKITVREPDFLRKHKKQVWELMVRSENKELQWHLALIAPRLAWTGKERSGIWAMLMDWAADKVRSRIVRVCALQALFEMSSGDAGLRRDFERMAAILEKENIPSIRARLRKLLG